MDGQSNGPHEAAYLARLHRLWAENWPRGVSRTVSYPFGEVPFSEILRAQARRQPDKPAYIFYGREITYGELDDLSDRFASLLAARGLGKGDRVAVFLQNVPQFVIAFYGILKAGCIHVPVNPMFKEQELAHELADSGAVALVALDELMPLVRAVRGRTDVRLVFSTAYADFLPAEPTIPPPAQITGPKLDVPDAEDLMEALARASLPAPKVEIGLDEVAALNYTGGTTGMPKGCIHTHRDMLFTAASAIRRDPASPPPPAISLAFHQMFWIAGENNVLLFPVFNGDTVVLMARWDPHAFLVGAEKYRATHARLVLDNVVELMERPDFKDYDLSALTHTIVASYVKKLNREYRARWRDLTGVTMVEGGWGMTETHTGDTVTAGMQDDDFDLSRRPVFVGFPVPGAEFKVCEFETGRLLPLGEEGELCVRTPSLFKGYWGRPGMTEGLTADGWFHTGDVGIIVEAGYLFFLGRRKEMLKVRGMSVFPGEIEALLAAHPAVLGCAVLPREDAHKGQVPVAFVQLEPQSRGGITEAELTLWCKTAMATYKVPEIRFIEALPLTATGKVKKHELAGLL